MDWSLIYGPKIFFFFFLFFFGSSKLNSLKDSMFITWTTKEKELSKTPPEIFLIHNPLSQPAIVYGDIITYCPHESWLYLLVLSYGKSSVKIHILIVSYGSWSVKFAHFPLELGSGTIDHDSLLFAEILSTLRLLMPIKHFLYKYISKLLPYTLWDITSIDKLIHHSTQIMRKSLQRKGSHFL